jgi:hypothetical protein
MHDAVQYEMEEYNLELIYLISSKQWFTVINSVQMLVLHSAWTGSIVASCVEYTYSELS